MPTAKQFRVVGLTLGEDFRRRVTAFEYDPSIYEAGVAGGGQIYVNSFTPPTVIGTQVITGLPWQPGAIIFWSTGATAEDSFQNTIYAMYGYASRTPENAAIAAATLDNVTTVTGARRNDNAHCIVFIDTAGVVVGEAAVTAMSEGSFTLNWTVTNWPGGVAPIVQYLALASIDVLDVDIVSWTMPTSGTRVVSGMAFRPDVALHIFLPLTTIPTTTTPTASLGIGGMSRDGTQFSTWSTVGAGFGGATDRRGDSELDSDRCVQMTSPVEAAAGALRFVSMNSDGFSVEVFGTAPAANYQVMSLCIRGLRHRFAVIAQRSGVGLQAFTGAGFATFGWHWFTHFTSQFGHLNRRFIGATDGTRQRSAGFTDVEEGTGVTSRPRHRMSSGQVGATLTDTPAVITEADYVSFDADGFTTDWVLEGGGGLYAIWFIGPGVMA